MCVSKIKIVNACRRDLPEELVDDIVGGASLSVVSNTAEQYNLRVAVYEVDFDNDANQKVITYTIGDTPGAA